ncbi:MAG: EAL domain-containing protein [Clostridiales bacterium]|nr:EAL domain-containing protein [Clostridiales bacterium]
MKELWNHFFGMGWEALGKTIPGICAFLLNRETETYLADPDFLSVLDLDTASDYTTVYREVERIKNGGEQAVNLLPLQWDDRLCVDYIFLKVHQEAGKIKLDNLHRLNELLDSNRFSYHFQPIVNAKGGSVFAYEALMRTDATVNMSPIQVLDAARDASRLYDVEKATLFNTLQVVRENPDIFESRKLFVNSLPGHPLTAEDWSLLEESFGPQMNKVVIEVTEQGQLDEERLHTMQQRIRKMGMELAIDDYGTGYSNTANLLRYQPDCVKIDRQLIDRINEKTNVQKLVSGLIDFFHQNGYLALAEGVETYEELKTMIRLGADLIQGYYTCKPQAFLTPCIPEALVEQIVQINLTYASENRVYRPEEGEVVEMDSLAARHYNTLLIDKQQVTLVGTPGKEVYCTISVKNDTAASVVMRNVSIYNPEQESPVIQLGDNSSLRLVLEGDNHILKRGIWVPETASFTLEGSGDLEIVSEMPDCYAIGTGSESSHGSILLKSTGIVKLVAKGGVATAVGGGKNAGRKSVRILSGQLTAECYGGNCVFFGCQQDLGKVYVQDASVQCLAHTNKTVGIGSMGGDVEVEMKNAYLHFQASCSLFCGFGSLSGGGNVTVNHCDAHITSNTNECYCIGSDGGSVSCDVRNSKLELICECDYATAIGDRHGSGNVTVIDTWIDFVAHCKAYTKIFTQSGTLVTEGIGGTLLELA